MSLSVSFPLPLTFLISVDIPDHQVVTDVSGGTQGLCICLTHGIAVQQEHSMGTAILLQCHIVGVDTIGVLLVLRESWGEGQEVIRQRLKREIEKKKKNSTN